ARRDECTRRGRSAPRHLVAGSAGYAGVNAAHRVRDDLPRKRTKVAVVIDRILEQRGEPLDPGVDQRLVDHAEREAHGVVAAAVGIEERARDDRDARLGGATRELGRVGRERHPREEAASRRRPAGAAEVTLERGERPLALAPVELAGARELILDPAAPDVLLEEALAERARALVGVLLRRDELRRDARGGGRPAQPDAREERLRGRPDLDDDLGREAPEARQRGGVEAELAVGDVLDDEEAVPGGELDERATPLDRQADAGRILVVGNRVEQLRPQTGGETPLELVDLEALVVHRHGDDI